MVIFDTIDAKFYKVMSMKIHILMSLFVKLKEIFTNFKKFGLFFGWYDISSVLSMVFLFHLKILQQYKCYGLKIIGEITKNSRGRLKYSPYAKEENV